MSLDFQRFYQACNPSRTLDGSDPEDQKYYIDFSQVRGSNIIRELERTITVLSQDQATCQLFTGHIGCGKSTELLQLKSKLEKQGFHVVYFESSQDLDMANVDLADVLMAITQQVSKSLEDIGIRIKPNYFVNLLSEVSDFLQTPVHLETEASLSIGIAKITSKTKESPGLRSQLRQFLEPRTNSILEALNKELFEQARKQLKAKSRKELVVIVDNLDRIDESLKPTERTQPEYLFVDRGEQLRKLNCHIIYTIPLVLVFSNDLGRLTNRFGVDPKVLPMIPVRLRNGCDCDEGLSLLRQMVLARAFPSSSQEQRLNLITELFDQVGTLDRLCRVSGGHVRNLLVLLYRCLQREDLPVSRSCLESIIKQRRNELSLAITDDEWDLLRQVSEKKIVSGEVSYKALLRSMFVFEYRSFDEYWFDVNPVLAESERLTV